jgi:hypothetical protein
MAEKFNLFVSKLITRTIRFHVSELYLVMITAPGVGKNCVWRDLVPEEFLESHRPDIDQTHRRMLMEVLIDNPVAKRRCVEFFSEYS